MVVVSDETCFVALWRCLCLIWFGRNTLFFISGSGNALEGAVVRREPVVVEGGSCVSLQTLFMLLFKPHVSVTFSAFFLFFRFFHILSPSANFQMQRVPLVYWLFFIFLFFFPLRWTSICSSMTEVETH